MNTQVKTIIPLYRTQMESWEYAALENNIRVLSSYPVCFLYPEDLEFNDLKKVYPQAEFRAVSTDWLGKKRGIAGYNEMMMSKDFYEMFADCEYILICHTDAWIFKDDLAEWCAKGYDLVAAPWPLRPRYHWFPLKQYIWFKKKRAEWSGNISRVRMFGRIGNGGLCLRKVRAFLTACDRYADEIVHFNSRPDDMHNEDIFWALVPEDFHYPDEQTAVGFAYDLKPRLCHKMNHLQLPMGCHGFMHKSRIRFWSQFIPCAQI